MSGVVPRAGFRTIKSALLLLLAGLICTATLSRAQPAPAANDPVTSATALISSLTEEQQAAISAMLAKYEAELAALAGGTISENGTNRAFLPLVIGPRTAAVRTPQEAELADASAPAGVAMLDGAQQVLAKMEAELAAILTPEQLSLYQAAVAQPQALQAEASAAALAGASLEAVSFDRCFSSAQWSNYAFAYINYARSFAIMSAFNVDFGTRTPAAVQSYISYNEAMGYALAALQDIATAAVMITARDLQVQNANGGTLFGVRGESEIKLANARTILGRDNALLDYLNSGGVVLPSGAGVGGNYFSYFAFAYGRNALFFTDGAIDRVPGCY